LQRLINAAFGAASDVMLVATVPLMGFALYYERWTTPNALTPATPRDDAIAFDIRQRSSGVDRWPKSGLFPFHTSALGQREIRPREPKREIGISICDLTPARQTSSLLMDVF
jgi:hypothetical protein